MKRHAKASSAGSTLGAGGSRSLVRRAFANRGASSDADGSGAPSHRARAIAGALTLTALLFALAASPASANQSLFDFFGSTGSGAGQLGKRFELIESVNTEIGAGGIAVNDTTGDVYVADRVNNRIEQWDSGENFIRGWGIDVIPNGATGTGTLTSGSKEATSVIITSKAFIPGQEVTVTAGSGTLPAATTITEVITGAGAASKLVFSKAATASGSVTLTVAEGSGNSAPQNEKQKVSVGATGGSFTLKLKTTSPTAETETASISYTTLLAPSAVQSALEALANVGAGNVEVTGANGGPYTVEFKGTRFANTNLAQMSASSSLTGAAALVRVDTVQEGAGAFEKCTTATTCQAGTVSGIGGSMGSPNSVAINQGTGDVYVTETGNTRVDQFSSTGSFIRAWGGNVVESGPDNKPEVQAVSVAGSSGTFALSYEGKSTIAAGTGTLASGSNEVTALTSTGTGAFLVGETISGIGIPAGTTIAAVSSGALTLSANATASASGVALSAGLPVGASAALVEQALNALTSVGGSFGSVAVSGASPYQITYGGTLANTNLEQVISNSNGIGYAVGTALSCTGGPGSGATLTYQWLRNGVEIAGATASTYTTVAEDAGKAVQCKVKATGSEGTSVKAGSAVVISQFPAIAPPLPGNVSITSTTPTVGATLTCAKGTWTGNGISFGFQWLRNGVPIAGKTSETYVAEAADNQTEIQCEVTGSNTSSGGGAVVAHSARVVIRSEPPVNTGTSANAPAITVNGGGAPVEGATLTCSNGTWEKATSGFDYQWLRNGEPIGAPNANTYTVVAADKGTAVQCVVTGKNPVGSASAASGNKVIEPIPSPTPPIRPSGALTVTGTRNVGVSLKCAKASWTPSSPAPIVTWKWLRNGAEIAGATSESYVLTAADLDKVVQCRQTASNASGKSVLISSAPASAGAVTVIAAPSASSSLVLPQVSSVSTSVNGGGPEICSAGDTCKGGTGGGGTLIPAGAFGSEFLPGKSFEGHLAISPAGPYAGDVFVADNITRSIQIFSANGALVGAFGVDTVEGFFGGPFKPLCLVALGEKCEMEGGFNYRLGSEAIENYGFWLGGPTQGTWVGQPPLRLALDSSGAVYVANSITLQKYSPDLLTEKDFVSDLCTSKSVIESCADVAVDPATNDVYVAHGVAGQNEALQTILKEVALVKYDSAGAESLETALEGSEVKPINGIAIDGSTGNERSGRAYLTTGSPEQRIDVLGEPTPPDVELDPVDAEAIESHSITATGTINPNGNKTHTEYRFEVVTQGSIWKSYPVPNVDIGNGAAPVSVEQTISGLRANTEYHIRLAALKGGRYTSPERTFTTIPTGPDIETGTAQWSGPPSSGPSLTFSGMIDDNNLAVHYYFEYGTDTSYGSRVPIFETSTHPGAQEAFTARQTVNGLNPAGTYHYRLIARTASGAAVGQDREVGPSVAGGRFPELVSPVDKGVGKVGFFLNFGAGQDFQIADSGERVAYPYQYGETEATAGGDLIYLASRETAGWQNTQLTPQSGGITSRPIVESVGGSAPGRIKWESPELDCAVIQARGSTEARNKLTPDTPDSNVTEFLYLRDEDGNLTLMTPSVNRVGAGLYFVAGGTSNCDRVVFQTTSTLLPGLPVGGLHVYEWESVGGPNGTLRSVEVLPDGSLPLGGAFFGKAQTEGQINAAAGPGLSRVFFSAVSTEGGDLGTTAVFVRKNHSVTVDASQSQTATPNDSNSYYQIASKNGSHVFLFARRGIASNGGSVAGPTECKQPAGGEVSSLPAGCDLYDYNVNTGALADITPDTNVADTNGAYVVGVYGVSDDGSDLYFAAKGQLVPGKGKTYAENTSGGGFSNVYLAHNGVLSFVGLIRGSETAGAASSAFAGNYPFAFNSSRVTPNGQFLLFRSKVNLTAYDSGGIAELYRYSKQDASVVCISCRSDGQLPHGDNRLMLPSFHYSQTFSGYLPRAISDDGSRVFFNSADKLTPDAIEGTSPELIGSTTRSAYEWHEGTIHLLAARGELYGASADSNDVFLLTREALVPQDQDLSADLYDLHIDGGFPYFPPQPCDPLTENSCQGTPPAPPAAINDPASSTFSGPGNPAVPGVKAKHPRKANKHHKHHKKAHKRAAKHNGGGAK